MPTTPSPRSARPPDRSRRALIGGGLALLAAGIAGCAVRPPIAAQTVSVPQATPRVGDTWRYRYISGWRQVPSRDFSVRTLEVTNEAIRDALSAEGFAGAHEARFTGLVELAPRSLGSGFGLMEFAPYLQAFVALAPGMVWSGIDMPVDQLPTVPWSAQARVRGTETVTVPAGTFSALRVDIFASRFGMPGVNPTGDPADFRATAWFAGEAKRVVRFRREMYTLRLNPLDRDGYELQSMSLAGA